MNQKKIATLCIIEDGEKILLAKKKRGHGEGRWNGYGGKKDETETIEESLLRELIEEAGIKVIDFEKRGYILFENEYENGLDLETHIYSILEYEGEPIETEEMSPKWFLKSEMPFDEMWPSDKKWLPIYLEGHKFIGNVKAEQSGRSRVEEFKIVDNLDLLNVGKNF